MPTVYRLFLTVAVIALLSAAQPLHAQKKFADAVEMNNYLITPNDSLYQKGQALGRAVGAGYATKDFTPVVPAKKAIIKYATETLAELKKVQDQFGSEEFRKGIIDFLTYEINIMKNRTPLLDKLNDKSTEKEIRSAIDEMIAESKDEAKFLQKVSEMQARFAEKNGFRVESPAQAVQE